MAIVISMVLTVFALGAGIGGADVADSTPELQIRSIDARDGQIVVDYVYNGDADGASATLTVDGNEVTPDLQTLSDAGVNSSAMVVLDSSGNVPNATVQLSKEPIDQFALGKGAVTQLGIVSSGAGARIIEKPTTDDSSLSTNLDDVIPKGLSSIWDGALIATDALGGIRSSQRNLILVVASTDDGSAATFSKVLVALREIDASVHVIAVEGVVVDTAALTDLVDRLGGSFQTGTDSDFAAMYDNVNRLISSQYRATLADTPSTESAFGNVVLSVGDAQVQASYRPNVVSTGSDNLRPIAALDAVSTSFFTSGFVKYLVIALFAAGAGGMFYAILNLLGKRNDGLKHTLRHYDESYTGEASEENEESNAGQAMLQRAVQVTGNIAEERGMLVRVDNLLERADLPLRSAEALTFFLGGLVVTMLLTFAVTRNIFGTLAVALFAMAAPGFIVDFLAKRRKTKFNRLLPDMLQLLAGTLRAGYSIGQGFEAVSGEIDEPMGKELRRAVTEARLGRPLDEALESVAFRMDSEDFGWAVMAIRIQREVGGNLAELLMTVSETMTQRERLKRDVASLTAEGRMSAIILGLLPPGLGLAMYVMNKDYISVLFHGTGLFLLGASVVMMIIGFIWMKKTITIEV